MIYGWGILKSLSVTFKRFVIGYVDDFVWLFKGGRYNPRALKVRQSPQGRGIFTVQYPKERLPLPENYRNFPFQVVEDGKPRCTACGICAKTCPPQCIWIVRGTDPETGKPKREPAEFHIDVSVCMSCGLCAEVCPFNALKMDHDLNILAYKRDGGEFLFDLQRLSKPVEYHAAIHPTAYAAEKAEQEQKAAKKKQ